MIGTATKLAGVMGMAAALAAACAAGNDDGGGGEGGTAVGSPPSGGQGGAAGSSLSTGGTAGAGGTSTTIGGSGGSAGGDAGSGGGVGGGGDVGCVIASYSFDGCTDGWTAGGRNSDWACGNVTSGPSADHTGDHFAWGTNLAGDAADCQNSWLESPVVDLSAYAGSSLRLSFWHWYDFRECVCGGACLATPNQSFSGGMIQVDSGGGFALVAPLGGYEHGSFYVNCAAEEHCGESPCELDEEASAFTSAGVEQVWHESTVDISAHATAAFQVRFLFGSHDWFDCFPRRPGWYVDDVMVYTEEPCP